MRAIRESLVRFGESPRPMIEVLGEDGVPARTLGYQEVTRRAADLAERIGHGDGRPLRIGVVCGNTPEFVVADLALIVARAIEVPVPLAFSAEQAAGLLEETDLCLADAAGQERLTQWGRDRVLRPDCTVLPLSTDGPVPSAPLVLAPEGVGEADWECKVIHTSGTTSRPKGVRIRAAALNELLGSLRSVMPRGAFARYLSVVPFSLLIEQVTGLYMVLLDGGTLVLMPPGKALVGTAAAAPADAMPYVAASRPTAMVATPALVDAFATAADEAAAGGRAVAPALFGSAEAPLICCGGAPVHPELLRRLEEHGLPVHEGYGLSENSSVVSWNTPAARRTGTVGRPLPHVRVKLADDGELLVNSTSLFAGYTRDDPSSLVLDPTAGSAPATWPGSTGTDSSASPAARRTSSSPRRVATWLPSGSRRSTPNSRSSAPSRWSATNSPSSTDCSWWRSPPASRKPKQPSGSSARHTSPRWNASPYRTSPWPTSASTAGSSPSPAGPCGQPSAPLCPTERCTTTKELTHDHDR